MNNLRTKTPMVDPVLAKIYFDTYAIPIGESIDNIKEAANEYEPDIIRFFLLNQRQRCEDIMSEIREYEIPSAEKEVFEKICEKIDLLDYVGIIAAIDGHDQLKDK